MKNKLLSSLPLSFYVWFLTPLLTFIVFLVMSNFNAEWPVQMLLLTPAVGCLSFAAWLSRTERFNDGLFLIAAEGCRGLYIFVVGYIFLAFQLSAQGSNMASRAPADPMSEIIIFLLPSLFFYLVPDTVIGIVNFGLRKMFPKTDRLIIATIVTLIGFAALYMSTQGLIGSVTSGI